MDILIIDDSRTSRYFVSNILEEQGYIVHQAVDGLSGLEKINELKPDLVILDLLMPNVDGFEVLEILNKRNIRIPIFVLSADIQDDVKKECIELGAKQFFAKPFTSSEMIAAIENIK